MRDFARRGDHRSPYFASRDAVAAGRDVAADDADIIANHLDQVRAEQDTAVIAEFPTLAGYVEACRDDRRRFAQARHRAREDRRSAYLDRVAAAFDRSLSAVDSLTGVYRREAGLSKLTQTLDDANRDHRVLVVGFIDVDRLKTINDTGGHAAGDDVLKTVAQSVATTLGPDDPLLRYGGDEFVFGVLDGNVDDINSAISVVNRSLRITHDVSISCGLAASTSGQTLCDIIAAADNVLYHQRSAGSSEMG